jgi:hypothetical protein
MLSVMMEIWDWAIVFAKVILKESNVTIVLMDFMVPIAMVLVNVRTVVPATMELKAMDRVPVLLVSKELFVPVRFAQPVALNSVPVWQDYAHHVQLVIMEMNASTNVQQYAKIMELAKMELMEMDFVPVMPVGRELIVTNVLLDILDQPVTNVNVLMVLSVQMELMVMGNVREHLPLHLNLRFQQLPPLLLHLFQKLQQLLPLLLHLFQKLQQLPPLLLHLFLQIHQNRSYHEIMHNTT